MGYLEQLNNGQIKLGLENISALMSRLGNPQNKLKIIHVAGTNGKGSVCQMLSSILQQAGYGVGVFTSPHLVTPEECIQHNEQIISTPQFEAYIESLMPIIKELEGRGSKPSYFELLTAVAFLYFKELQVDFVILEVGLGGRLDATNVIDTSLISVLTKITRDHTDFLGETLESIAAHKAGIIKAGGRVVMPRQDQRVNQVIAEVCENQKAKLTWMDPSRVKVITVSDEGTLFQVGDEVYQTGLIGAHQAYNGALAIEVIHTLQAHGEWEISEEQIKLGLSKARWPGRFEKVSDRPEVFVDGAHNVDGMSALADTISKIGKEQTIGVIGILRDKEVDKMLEIICPYFEQIIVTEPANPRAMSGEELKGKIVSYGKRVLVRKEIREAIDEAMKLAEENGNRIIVCGSLYMIGEARNYLINSKRS